MNSFYYMLQKIREKPGLYLKKPTLEGLNNFWIGYNYGSRVMEWENREGRSYFENPGEEKPLTTPYTDHFMYGFDEFVHSYYQCEATTMKGIGKILYKSESDEEAFYKFFELLDLFLEKK